MKRRLILALVILPASTGWVSADYTWFQRANRFPTEAEIKQAADACVRKGNYVRGNSDYGHESRSESLAVIKLHDPLEQDPVYASMVMLFQRNHVKSFTHGEKDEWTKWTYAFLFYDGTFQFEISTTEFNTKAELEAFHKSLFAPNPPELLRRNRKPEPFKPGWKTKSASGAAPTKPKAQDESVPADGPAPWSVAVGSLATVICAAAAATSRWLRKKAARKDKEREIKKKEDEEEDDTPIAYILQLSASELLLKPNEPAPLEITAWKVDQKGAYHRASSAALTIEEEGTEKAVSLSPSSGTETMTCSVSLSDPCFSGEAALAVSAAAGKNRTSAKVTVRAQALFRVEFF